MGGKDDYPTNPDPSDSEPEEEEDKPKRRSMKRVGSEKDTKSKREKRYLKVFDDEAEEDDVDDEEEEAEEGYDIAKVEFSPSVHA